MWLKTLEHVLDYASELKNAIMEEEHKSGVFTYRYVYGFGKEHAVIYEIANGAGGLIQTYSLDPGAAVVEYGAKVIR